MKYSLVVFDWDGTLVDSTHHIVECIRMASAATGADFPGVDAAMNIIGLGMKEAIVDMFGERDQAFIDEFRAAYSDHFFSLPASRSDLFFGVLELLQQLRGSGLKVAIATGKSRRGMDRALLQMALQDMFHAVKCADETASKPDPMMLQQLLEEFNLRPEQAVMIGDTEYDMAMAAGIGMPRIAVSYGAHVRERLRPFAPEAIVHCASDLMGVLV